MCKICKRSDTGILILITEICEKYSEINMEEDLKQTCLLPETDLSCLLATRHFTLKLMHKEVKLQATFDLILSSSCQL